MSRCPFRPGRKISFRTRVNLSQGMLRAARTAADNDRCAVAELLLAFATPNLHVATKQVGGRVRSAVKVLDAGSAAMDAAAAVMDCHARARTKTGTEK